YENADEETRKGLRILEARVGRDNTEMGKAYHNLAAYLFHLGKYEEAEDFLRRALEIRQKRGRAQYYTALTLMSLANCLLARADKMPGRLNPVWIAEARKHLDDAAEIGRDCRRHVADLRAGRVRTANFEDRESQIQEFAGYADSVAKRSQEILA